MASIEVVEIMKTLRTERSHTRKELRKLEKAISARHKENDGRNSINSEHKVTARTAKLPSASTSSGP